MERVVNRSHSLPMRSVSTDYRNVIKSTLFRYTAAVIVSGMLALIAIGLDKSLPSRYNSYEFSEHRFIIRGHEFAFHGLYRGIPYDETFDLDHITVAMAEDTQFRVVYEKSPIFGLVRSARFLLPRTRW